MRLADVAPTILELAGFATFPSQSTPGGVSLVSIMKGQQKDLPAYSETYYTKSIDGLGTASFNQNQPIQMDQCTHTGIFTILIPIQKENKNLYSSGSVPSSMKREMDRFAVSKPVAPQIRKQIQKVRERLASLGYVTGSSSIPAGSATFDPKNGIHTWEKN